MAGDWSDSLDHLVHLLVAFVLALPIGWNRARADQGAGLRTFPLVAIASCGFVQTAISVLGPGLPNQANIMQGIITGVGFIGAAQSLKKALLLAVTLPRPASGRWVSSVRRSAMVITISGSSWPLPISLS